MHQNIRLGSNGVDRMRSLWKIPTRLRGTNFGTSTARFASIFVRQSNGPKSTQIVRITPKHKFRVQWGGSGAFVAKNSNTTSFSNFCTSSAHFAPRFLWQPNGPKCTQIVRITPKHKFRSNGVDQLRSLRKIQTRLRGMNFCTSLALLHRVL